jgi:hypothetical protein
MPYFSPGSSQLTIAPPPPPAPAVVDKLAELSADEPLPETYAANRIRLLAQSPRKLYLYWEFERDPLETLRRAFGPGQAQRYRLVVKLVDLETGRETLHLASPTRSQWLDAQPGRSYRVDVGFYAEGRAFIRLLSSSASATPRTSVSRLTDSTTAFEISADEFARVLDDAGYISDALEVSLEAADLATANAATRAVALRFGGTGLPAMNDETLAEMRGLLASLALGIGVDELQAALSATLSRWLEEATLARREAIDAAHLLEALRTLLGLEFDSTELDAFNEEAMRRAARVIVGASEVNLPLRPFHLWMPSMTAGRLAESGRVVAEREEAQAAPPTLSPGWRMLGQGLTPPQAVQETDSSFGWDIKEDLSLNPAGAPQIIMASNMRKYLRRKMKRDKRRRKRGDK